MQEVIKMKEAIQAITNKDFLAAITITISLIILGFVLRKKNLFNEHSKKTITTILMKIALPCLAFSGFIMDFDVNTLVESGWIILFTVLAYLACLGIGRIVFHKQPKENKVLYSILMTFGQITLFGLPLVKAIYGNDGLFVGNIMSIPFRLFVYIYCFIVVSGTKIEKGTMKSTLKNVFCNPIIIAMLVSMVLWIAQPILPKVTINENSYSIFRIDYTVPWLYKAIHTISELTMPLSMLLIGVTLGEIDVKKAFSNKKAWFISIFRSVLSTLVIGIIIYLFCLIPSIDLSKEIIASVIICFSAPVSAVVNTFCVTYNREPILSSDTCFLSTLSLIIFVPFIIMLVQLIF